jgi:predicted AlkP superfamily pyrophosphatase or phosphodiesterase
MSLMLPAPPKTLGKLGDVLISALASVRGEPNQLSLPKRRSILVLLVDGLGMRNIQEAGAHAGFLNSQKFIEASCYYPSTTASSIVSFATGKPPWENNFIGYQVFDRSQQKAMNLLSGWESQNDAASFQPLQTVSEQAVAAGIEFHTISPSIYKESGFTAATMRGARFHGVNSIGERFAKAQSLLSSAGSKVVYLYVPELDQTAHAKGCKSTEWLQLLEDIDSEVSKLATVLPKNSGFILTSDHGVIDIPKHNHIYLDEYLSESELDYVGGDTRGLFVYLKDSSTRDSVLGNLRQDLDESCYLVTPEDLVKAGYWKSLASSTISPDFIVLARKEIALYHRSFAKRKSLEMIGHHGSISSAEMSIPLMTFGF